MARRGRSGRPFIRPAARTKMWIGDGVGTENIAGSTKVLSATLSAAVLALRPFTILRSHLEIYVRSDQFVSIESVVASFGSIVVTEAAAAVGVTAIPDPSAISGDADADWFIWTPLSFVFFIDINGTDGIGVDGDLGHHYMIDSKAMRKVGPDDQVANVFANEGASGFSVTTQGRQLIQLH